MENFEQDAANAMDSTDHDVTKYQIPLDGEDDQSIVSMFVTALEKECRNGGKVRTDNIFS